MGRLRWTVLAGIALAVYVFLLGPTIAVVLASFERGQNYSFSLIPRQPSLEWYTHIPPRYLHALVVSIIVGAVSAALATVLGAMAALALVRGRLAARSALDAFFRVPLQLPAVVVAIAFLQFYNQLALAGGFDLLGSPLGLVLAHLFFAMPYSVSSVGVLLMRIGPQYEEAAAILGATPWSTFRRVTLPTLRPGLFAGFIYAFIASFGDVPVALFVTGGSRNTTMPVEIFLSLQFDFDPAILSLSTVVVVLSALGIIAIQRLLGLDLLLPSNRRL